MLLLKKLKEKFEFLSLHVRHRSFSTSLSRSSRHLKPISLAKYLYQMLKPKKMALGMPLTLLNAASNLTYSAIASQDSPPETTTFKAHCTVHFVVGDFNVTFAKITKQSQYDTVPYCVRDVIITCRSATYLTSWVMEL